MAMARLHRSATATSFAAGLGPLRTAPVPDPQDVLQLIKELRSHENDEQHLHDDGAGCRRCKGPDAELRQEDSLAILTDWGDPVLDAPSHVTEYNFVDVKHAVRARHDEENGPLVWDEVRRWRGIECTRV